jgi:hypothetical protein
MFDNDDNADAWGKDAFMKRREPKNKWKQKTRSDASKAHKRRLNELREDDYQTAENEY